MNPRRSNALVSTIIVSYRNEATIAPCVRSAIEAGERLRLFLESPEAGADFPRGIGASFPGGGDGDGCARGGCAHEIIVVDNQSGDATLERVREFGPAARLIANRDNRGFSRAVNQGLRASQSEFAFLLNPDCRVEPDALISLVKFLRATPQAGACGPKILSPDGSVQLSCRAFPDHSTAFFHRHSLLTRLFPHNPHSHRYLKTRWDHSARAQVDWVSGAAMMLRREALRQAGEMDEDYFLYCEDVDLCWRLRERGWATFYVPEAVVWHHVGRSSRQAPYRSLYERHRSMYTFYKKHYSLNIPLIDFATFCGIAARCMLYLGLAWSGRPMGHHGETPAKRPRPAPRGVRQPAPRPAGKTAGKPSTPSSPGTL